MKSTLEFTLPEEREELDLALNAGKMACVISDLDNWLRSLQKYQDKDTVSVEEVREELHRLMRDE